MALLAMDQYGYLLNHLTVNSRLTVDLGFGGNLSEAKEAAILLPSTLVLKEDSLPHSWQVTSDSIAAWVAFRTGARRLILLKDVDGLLGPDGLIPELTAKQLTPQTGGVDGYMSNILSTGSLETWVLNGLHPRRLAELLETAAPTEHELLNRGHC
jgi:aspartokinase-like uncharacterized kinase